MTLYDAWFVERTEVVVYLTKNFSSGAAPSHAIGIGQTEEEAEANAIEVATSIDNYYDRLKAERQATRDSLQGDLFSTLFKRSGLLTDPLPQTEQKMRRI